MAKKRKYPVKPAEFVAVWQQSETVDDVAKTLKMPKPIVQARASKYREAGIKLKKMSRPKRPDSLDVDALNQLIRDLEEK